MEFITKCLLALFEQGGLVPTLLGAAVLIPLVLVMRAPELTLRYAAAICSMFVPERFLRRFKETFQALDPGKKGGTDDASDQDSQ